MMRFIGKLTSFILLLLHFGWCEAPDIGRSLKELWRMASSLQFHVPAIFSLEVVSAFSRASLEQDAINMYKVASAGARFVIYPIDDSFLEKATAIARD